MDGAEVTNRSSGGGSGVFSGPPPTGASAGRGGTRVIAPPGGNGSMGVGMQEMGVGVPSTDRSRGCIAED